MLYAETRYILRYPDGIYVQVDNSSGPMSSGGYPFPTVNIKDATDFKTYEKATEYAKMFLRENWKIIKVAVYFIEN